LIVRRAARLEPDISDLQAIRVDAVFEVQSRLRRLLILAVDHSSRPKSALDLRALIAQLHAIDRSIENEVPPDALWGSLDDRPLGEFAA
jgi:hypothetical protein